MLAAGESLRAAYPVLRRLSARHLRAICRQWYRAGWSPARIVHALDNAPDGTAHACDTEVRHLARWMMARLDLWRDPATGQPLPSSGTAPPRPAPREPRPRHRTATRPGPRPPGPAPAAPRSPASTRRPAAASSPPRCSGARPASRRPRPAARPARRPRPGAAGEPAGKPRLPPVITRRQSRESRHRSRVTARTECITR